MNSLVQQMREMIANPVLVQKSSGTPHISKEEMNSFLQEELKTQDLTSVMAICGGFDPGPDPADDPNPEVFNLQTQTPHISRDAMNSLLQGELKTQDLTSVMAVCGGLDPGPDPADDPNPEVSSLENYII